MGGLEIADEAHFVSKRPSKRYGERSVADGTMRLSSHCKQNICTMPIYTTKADEIFLKCQDSYMPSLVTVLLIGSYLVEDC